MPRLIATFSCRMSSFSTLIFYKGKDESVCTFPPWKGRGKTEFLVFEFRHQVKWQDWSSET